MPMRETDDLPDHVIDRIAEQAAERALEKFTDKMADEILAKAEEKLYAGIGKRVVERVFKVVGWMVVAGILWLAGSGQLNRIVE